MLLLRGAAGMAWLLTAEPVIKAAASAAITMPVFIGFPFLLRCARLSWGKDEIARRRGCACSGWPDSEHFGVPHISAMS